MIFFGDSDTINGKDSTVNPDVHYATACVKMALEMQADMKWVNDYWKTAGIQNPLKIRIGINTGYATVGNYGTDQRMDYTIIGGQVNIAARLESAAEAGYILISDSTKTLVQNSIVTQSMGEITVKGIHTPILIHKPIGVKDKKSQDSKRNLDKYLNIEKDKGMILKEIVYDVNQKNYSIAEKKLIVDSLNKAIDFIKEN